MLLKNLKIFSNGIEIRNIPFKTGLNLILDNETILGTESGNSIGKTTLLRIVDYCLGSDGKDIYTDPEFKTEYNTEVYNFVQNNQVSAQLELTLRNNTNIILERNLIIEGEKYYKINDEEISSITKYREKLSELIFKNKASKPSLRQLVPKFIRSDASKMSNTIMYLHKSTSPREYEPIFLFLFGFPEPTLFSNKSSLSREQKDYEKRLSVYEKPHSKNVIEQMLNVVNGNIVSEEIKINEFRLSDAYHHELENIRQIKSKISKLSTSISEVDLRIDLNQQTIEELTESSNEIDSDYVQNFYDDAAVYLPNLQKKFDDVLNFHSKMVENKVNFIEKYLSKLKQDRNELQKDLDKALFEESSLLQALSNSGTLNDLEVMRLELNRLLEQKGGLEASLQKINETTEQLQKISTNLEEINGKIERYIADFNEKVTVFNTFFSKYSKKLYEEEYIFSYEKKDSDEYYKFKIANISGNVGGGKKKGQVAAFDLAYISFINEVGLLFPQFVLHDSIEDIHANQIETLFSLANEINGQYVVAVLKDKIKFLGNDYINQNTILCLDQHNKFFRI